MLGRVSSANPNFCASISDKDIDGFKNAKQHFSDCYLMTTLETLSHTPNGCKVLKEHIIKINSLEEQGDSIFISSMHSLHNESKDVLYIIAWRDIYTVLEKCIDTAEHIADIVESIVMKNS